MVKEEGRNFRGGNLPLEDPLVVINGNYEVLSVNDAAIKLFGPPENKPCYKYLYGFDKPCGEEPGFSCPLCKEDVKFAVRYAVTKEGLKKFFVRFYTLKGNGSLRVAELLLPYGEVVDLFQKYPLDEGTTRDGVYLSKQEFEDLLVELLEKRKKTFYLITVNIKKLKFINEIYGIPAGDAVIKAVEAVFSRLSADYDFKFTQLAGGFFVVFVDKSLEEILQFERLLLKEFRHLKVRYLEHEIYPKITVTTVEVDPALIRDIKTLYKLIFYAEKVREEEELFHLLGKDQKRILEFLQRKEQLTAKLQRFLVENRITYHLQPIVNLKTDEVSHFEVLMRFRENGTVVSAGKFIDLIYELGLMVDFDLKMLDLLEGDLEKLALLRKPVFINVSAEDLKLLNYRNRLNEFLTRAHEKGVVVYLELTEQTVFDEWGFLEFLAKKHALEFAIDDFGTGYSSLKVVTDLAAKKITKLLKLDISLVSNYLENPYTKALIDTIIEFAGRFDIDIVGEGIETEELYRALKEAGLTYGQGYYFSKPLPLEEAIKKYAPSTG